MKGFRVVLLVAVVVGASCGARRADAPAVELDATTVVSVLSPPLAAPTLVAQAPPTSVAAMSELAALVRFLGSAEYDAAENRVRWALADLRSAESAQRVDGYEIDQAKAAIDYKRAGKNQRHDDLRQIQFERPTSR